MKTKNTKSISKIYIPRPHKIYHNNNFGIKIYHLATLQSKAPRTKLSICCGAGVRVARFFLVQHTKTGKSIPIYQKYTKWQLNIPKWP
jgi:hypothetical protein